MCRQDVIKGTPFAWRRMERGVEKVQNKVARIFLTFANCFGAFVGLWMLDSYRGDHHLSYLVVALSGTALCTVLVQGIGLLTGRFVVTTSDQLAKPDA